MYTRSFWYSKWVKWVYKNLYVEHFVRLSVKGHQYWFFANNSPLMASLVDKIDIMIYSTEKENIMHFTLKDRLIYSMKMNVCIYIICLFRHNSGTLRVISTKLGTLMQSGNKFCTSFSPAILKIKYSTLMSAIFD